MDGYSLLGSGPAEVFAHPAGPSVGPLPGSGDGVLNPAPRWRRSCFWGEVVQGWAGRLAGRGPSERTSGPPVVHEQKEAPEPLQRPARNCLILLGLDGAP